MRFGTAAAEQIIPADRPQLASYQRWMVLSKLSDNVGRQPNSSVREYFDGFDGLYI